MKREKDITILFDTNEELLKEVIRNQKEILYYLKNKNGKEYSGDRDAVEEILTFYQAHAIHGQKWYITTAFEEDLEKIRIDYGRPEIWMASVDGGSPEMLTQYEYGVNS